tara:strand:+ start:2061 stop:2360 length:300 start_codon:yes stop_codon:yes gene_type:complete
MSCKQETTRFIVKFGYRKMMFDNINDAFAAYQLLSAAQYVDDAYVGEDSTHIWHFEPKLDVTLLTINTSTIYDSHEQAKATFCPTDKPDNLDDDEAVAA